MAALPGFERLVSSGDGYALAEFKFVYYDVIRNRLQDKSEEAMITLRDTIEIKTSPQKIFEWFTHLDKNYRAWHPKDHVECRYLKGSPLERDSIVYVEEYLHGHLEKMKFQTTNVEPNSRIEYRVLFPYSLLGMRGSFIMEPCEAGSLFIAEIYLGSKTPLFGRLMDKFIQILFGRQLEAVKQHMAEEGQNLKRILEEDTG